MFRESLTFNGIPGNVVAVTKEEREYFLPAQGVAFGGRFHVLMRVLYSNRER